MLRSCLPAGKRRVCINMDETSVKLRPPASRGFLVAGARAKLRGRSALAAHGTKGEQRCNLTQLVFICDDDEVQAALPTILLVSKRAFSQAMFEKMKSMLPPHIHLWRQQRAWVTGRTMSAACRLVASVLQPWIPRIAVIFCADTYRGHLTKGVWDTMARLRFAYLLIPAKLTWALQPCDTHVFAGYKRQLVEEQQVRRIAEAELQRRRTAALSPPPGVAPVEPVLNLIESLVAAFEKTVQQRSWTAAFASNGLGDSLLDISPGLLQQLTFEAMPSDMQSWPTLKDFQHIFPARSDIPVDSIFAVLRPPSYICEERRAMIPFASAARTRPPVTRSASGSVALRALPPVDSAPCPMPAPVPKAEMTLRRVPTAKRLGPPRR